MSRVKRRHTESPSLRVDRSLVPQRVVAPFAFAGHLPFVLWLVPRWRPRRVVELGVHTGNSLFALAQAAAELRADGHPCEVFGVDTWIGDSQAGSYGEEVHQSVAKAARSLHPEHLTLVRSSFDEAIERFEPGSIDLLHIDGFHSYEAVRHDFETWRDRLSARSVVLFHDVCVTDRDDFGVHRFWDELRRHHPHATFRHSHGLGVLFVGRELGVLERRVVETLTSADRFTPFAESMATLGHLITAVPDSAPPTVTQPQVNESTRLRSELASVAGMVGSLRDLIEEQGGRTLASDRVASEARIEELEAEQARLESTHAEERRQFEAERTAFESARRAQRDELDTVLRERELVEVAVREAAAAAAAMHREFEAQLAERDRVIAGLAGSVQSAEARTAEAERRAAASEARIETHVAEARTAAEALVHAGQRAEDHRREATDLRRSLRMAEQRGSDLADSLRESHSRLGSLLDACDRLRTEVARERGETRRLQAAADASEGERRELATRVQGLENLVESLRRSSSWRITAPLRFIARGFRRESAAAPSPPVRRDRPATPPSLWPAIIHRIRRPGRLIRSTWRAMAILLRHGPHGVAAAIRSSRYAHASGTGIGADLRSLRTRPTTPRPTTPSANESADQATSKSLVSVVVPVFNTPPDVLRETIDSVLGQTWPNWELLLVDDASTAADLEPALAAAAAGDSRVRVIRRTDNGGISAATNDGLAAARGVWVAFLDHDDLLEPEALEACVGALESEGAEAAYTDQMTIDEAGRPGWVHLKPDWSPEHFRHVMYVGHLLVVRRSLAIELGGFLREHDGVQDFEFMLRLGERTERIVHLPQVLYRWRAIAGSLAAATDAKRGIDEKQANAVQAHLDRLGIPARAEPHPRLPHRCRVLPVLTERPRVSIVIPTRDQPDHIRTCLDSIHERTRWPDLEVVLVDTGTTDPRALAAMARHPATTVRFDRPFNFSAACNAGAAAASGSILVFLNNDTEVLTSDWIDHLVLHLLDPGVGAAGPLLLFPDGSVQHAGVVLGPRGTADHVMRGFPADVDGYAGSLSTPREVSAVTGACLAIRRETFERIGGFRETYGTHYQDVDLCLRLRREGLRIVCTPEARLHHHESPSRGSSYDFLDRLLLLDTWGDCIRRGDPYYPAVCSLERLDYSIDRARVEVAR